MIFKVLILFIFFIISLYNNSYAGAISNWFYGLIDIKKPKQHKNSFYIAGGYVYNTIINTKIYQSGSLIAYNNKKEYGGKGFNIALGYRHNFDNFFISPELSFTSVKIGMVNDFLVSDITYNTYFGPKNFKYYDDVYLKNLISFSSRFGFIFKDRLLTYGRLSVPTIMTNDYSHFGSISDYGYGLGFGAGLEFNISTNFFVRLEYNYYLTLKATKINNGKNLDGEPLKIKQNLGFLSLSIGLNFNVDDC